MSYIRVAPAELLRKLRKAKDVKTYNSSMCKAIRAVSQKSAKPLLSCVKSTPRPEAFEGPPRNALSGGSAVLAQTGLVKSSLCQSMYIITYLRDPYAKHSLTRFRARLDLTWPDGSEPAPASPPRA